MNEVDKKIDDGVVETAEVAEETRETTDPNDGNVDNTEEYTDSTGDDDGTGDSGDTDTGNENDGVHELPLDSKIKLPSGEVVDATELMRGYMRETDYVQKTQELGEVRRQLQISASADTKTSTVDTPSDKVKSEIMVVKEQLAELAEDDPQAKALTLVLDQLEAFDKRINDQDKAEQEIQNKEKHEKQVEYYKKFTNTALDEEAKGYNLPKYKDPKSGKEVDFSQEWRESVIRIIQSVDENLTIPEYRNLIKVKGREAYEKLRTIIGAITTHTAKKPKPSRPTPADSGNDKIDPPTLADKLLRGLEKAESERTNKGDKL